MKKVLSVLAAFLLVSSLYAANASYTTDDYVLNVSYNDELIPGDAVFCRMKFTFSKKSKKTDLEPKAVMELYQKGKRIDKSVFYSVNKSKKNIPNDFLTGIPLSSWMTENEYSLKILFTLGTDTKEFSLPVKFVPKSFPEEVIPLDEKNTAIKTDNSAERAQQINKLNNILETIMSSDVYTLKPFVSPTTSTRYTSYFGDRRTYAYSNGKSSTNLHYGNDYGIPTGSEVKACGDGKVVLAEMRNSTGWSVVIEHLPGLYSLYYHCDSLNVKEGDMVKQGQLIAKSGCTGLATGPHLHWEIRLNMCAVRPEFFLQDYTFNE